MKKFFLGIALTLFALGAASCASVANASTLALTTGYEGGSYHGVFGRNLGQILAERGHDVSLHPSAGSVENLDRVAAGDADVGFAQADAYASWSQTSVGTDVEILGSLGEECIYLAGAKGGKVSDESHLQQGGIKIAVGEQGSGSAVSWDYLRSLEDNYQKASTYYQGGILALSKVKTGQLDAFLWVTSPANLDHKYLQAVRAKGSGLVMADVNDWNLNNDLPNGEQVYEFKDVVVAKGIFDTKVEVPCTDVLVIANADLDSGALEDLATAVMMNASRIQGK